MVALYNHRGPNPNESNQDWLNAVTTISFASVKAKVFKQRLPGLRKRWETYTRAHKNGPFRPPIARLPTIFEDNKPCVFESNSKYSFAFYESVDYFNPTKEEIKRHKRLNGPVFRSYERTTKPAKDGTNVPIVSDASTAADDDADLESPTKKVKFSTDSATPTAAAGAQSPLSDRKRLAQELSIIQIGDKSTQKIASKSPFKQKRLLMDAAAATDGQPGQIDSMLTSKDLLLMGFNVDNDRASLRQLETHMAQFGTIHASLPVFTTRSTMLVVEYATQQSCDLAIETCRATPLQIHNRAVTVCRREDFLGNEFCSTHPKEIIISGFPKSWKDHEFITLRAYLSCQYGVVSGFRVQRLSLGAAIVRVVLKDNTAREAMLADAYLRYKDADLYVYSEDLVEPSLHYLVAGGSREWDEFILDDLRVYFEKFGVLTNFVYRNSADDKIEILLSYPDRDVHFKMSYLDGQVRFNGHNLSIRELPAAAA